MMNCTVVIPAYRPPKALYTLIEALRKQGFSDVILIDDGSGEEYRQVFDFAADNGVASLRHEENKGKGAALKTAFQSCLGRDFPPEMIITADGDGQHQIDDISKMFYTIQNEGKDRTIFLGTRNFNGDIPLRSRVGNSAASLLMKTLYQFPFEDTQTGLRAFSGDLLEWLTKIPGTRYEYETNVLIAAAKEHIPVQAVEVPAIYAVQNGVSHYRPLRDSLRVTAAMLSPFRRKE